MLLTGLIISSCQISGSRQPEVKINAVFTAAAQTVEAKLTQIPLSNQAATATISILPTDPPPTAADTPAELAPTTTLTATITEPPKICDAAQFIGDGSIPDGTVLKPGEPFTKTWRLKNIGTCAWNSSYSLVFDVGDQMGGPMSIPLAVNVAPGQEVDLSVSLQAPAETGSYRSYWRLRNPDGLMLTVQNGYKGKSFYVDIQVKNGKNSNSRGFAVTGVEFHVTHSGSCSSGTYTVAAAVRVTGAGEVSYSWKRSDGTDDPLGDGKLTFAAAGVQVINYDWPSGATGLSVMLFIDSSNPQEFGPALLNCL
jgi:hypothetical protein